MESMSSARQSPPAPPRGAFYAKQNPPPPTPVAMDEAPYLPINPHPGFGPGPVNATRRLPRRGSSSPEEYIEISSSPPTPSSPPSSDTSDREEAVHEHKNPLLQELQGPPFPSPRQFSSPPSPELGAIRGTEAAARDLDNFTPQFNRSIHKAQQNLMGDEMSLSQNSDNFDVLDIQDPELARLMEEEFLAQMGLRQPENDGLSVSSQQAAGQSQPTTESKDTCLNMVLTVFPDICPRHVTDLYDTISKHGERVIAHILENMDGGMPYPKAKDTKKPLKRKRELDEDEEATLKYDSPGRSTNIGNYHRRDIRTMLAMEFPETPMAFIDVCLRQNQYRIFPTYRVLEEAERTYSLDNPPYNKIRTKRKSNGQYDDCSIKRIVESTSHSLPYTELLLEFQAARRVRRKAEAKREEAHLLELAEEANLLKAQADGTMLDCQCCFGDYPMNRMVHCDSDELSHWFCKDCAKRNAETVIGQSKYQLVCMATDGCASSFSMAQRSYFLDGKMVIALERNEQEANLRMAGIENLASCPFCPYAAEYPPVEVDKEFRCEAPECERVSCRLCKLESHIPKSCEENAKEVGLSVRRQIEEAMSEALIRKCNKCGTPFVKDEGCNKMTCTRSGCGNVQCYVCSQSCTYAHFNDQSRGGKTGNCPLFEKTSQRHENEVKNAEMEALAKIRTEHPEYTEEDLAIKVSENVLQDEERRRSNEIMPFRAGLPPYPHHDILRIERPVPPVLLETPDPAPLRRQEPRAGEMVGIQYPKPPQSKPSPDDGAPLVWTVATMPLEREKLQLELPVAARKAFHPPPAMVPRQPALRPVHFGAEERSSPQIYQPTAHQQDWPIARRKLDVVPQFSPPLFINPNALVHKAEVDVKLPEHQTIGRVENNRFGFDNQDGKDIYREEIRPRFISKAQLGCQAGKGGRTISDPLDNQNTGLYEEPRTIAMPSDMARAQRERQRLEMQPIRTVNSLRLPIQQSNEVASETGELMPHVMRPHNK